MFLGGPGLGSSAGTELESGLNPEESKKEIVVVVVLEVRAKSPWPDQVSWKTPVGLAVDKSGASVYRWDKKRPKYDLETWERNLERKGIQKRKNLEGKSSRKREMRKQKAEKKRKHRKRKDETRDDILWQDNLPGEERKEKMRWNENVSNQEAE